MEFQKLSIQPEGKDAFKVLFNPTQYSVAKANQIAEATIPGLEAPILQYVHGNTRTLTMDLFCDTFEENQDVRGSTDQVYQLLKIDPSTHAPPICNLSWGTFKFRGVLDHVSGQFTMFKPDGTPVRATLSVVFKEFIDVQVLVQEQPTESADHRKTHVIRTGDRLDNIAAREYGDAGNWRPIADANEIDDPRKLKPGRVLIIPPLC